MNESEVPTMRLASTASRVAAASIDFVAYLGLGLVLGAFASRLAFHSAPTALTIAVASWFALDALVAALPGPVRGSSLGKLLMGLTVVAVTGEPLTVAQALARSVLRWPAALLSINDLRRSSLQDKIIGARVVNRAAKSPAESKYA